MLTITIQIEEVHTQTLNGVNLVMKCDGVATDREAAAFKRLLAQVQTPLPTDKCPPAKVTGTMSITPCGGRN